MSPNGGGGEGLWCLSQWLLTAVHRSPNKLWRSNSMRGAIVSLHKTRHHLQKEEQIRHILKVSSILFAHKNKTQRSKDFVCVSADEVEGRRGGSFTVYVWRWSMFTLCTPKRLSASLYTNESLLIWKVQRGLVLSYCMYIMCSIVLNVLSIHDRFTIVFIRTITHKQSRWI